MPAAVRAAIQARAGLTLPVEGTSSSCTEYTALSRGVKDFVVYHRLHPWDHAPGALILTEAGGACRHPDGSPYRIADASQPTLLVRHAALAAPLAATLFGTSG
jgi:fructose-1,6-bisphosphatase/inositol monophosphatase family enzyme